ncbi:electron transport complex subunit RsxC [Endozoicomonas montiporae]|uniref:Ion-translocating oxidoreductase complex subunit C n=1 Tax=Endozoicomonas montiporae CL-33 TaxID=570277 RepID=A0A142B831_9GAMM|nr:electron transport complex subunit RsxC [Endozoicomonas montiporae]AMO54907.1 RnfABCDGE type electron transport complex subunit C2 [Endozoicomonas montiporae CL-33]
MSLFNQPFTQKGFLKLPWQGTSFANGIHPEDHKELTEHKPIRRMPFSNKIIVPLSQSIGAPAKPIVTKGQDVMRGEPIAEAGGFVSAPIHAPVTGTVSAVDELVSMPNGSKTPAILIDTWPSSDQAIRYLQPRDTKVMSADELVKAVQDAGVVGLGGAAFPTHVKMKAPKGKTITTLVANGCECEPYLTCDHRTMLEQTDNLLKGLQLAMVTSGAEKAIIGIEDNKMDAVEKIREAINKQQLTNITCEAVPTCYPQGAEKMLLKSLLGLEVPAGGIPADIGCAVFNVGTLAQIGELVPEGRGLIERIVTVSGPGVSKPGNYIIPLGTPLPYVLEQVGAIEKPGMIILGGPMMGMSIATRDIATTKGITGILVFPPEQLPCCNEPEMPCIGCRACVEACPMYLNPSMLGKLADVSRHQEMMDEYHLMNCFECGCCSNSCPANIPLTQKIRVAKQSIRQKARNAR